MTPVNWGLKYLVINLCCFVKGIFLPIGIPSVDLAFELSNVPKIIQSVNNAILSEFIKAGCWDVLYVSIGPLVLPGGESWAERLPRDWHKQAVFGTFVPVGNDVMLKILRRAKTGD